MEFNEFCKEMYRDSDCCICPLQEWSHNHECEKIYNVIKYFIDRNNDEKKEGNHNEI